MEKRLTNKVAVVTGGSAGIGLGAAKCFVAEGAQVFITGRRQSELDKAVAEIGRNVTAVRGDASDLADIDRIYETVRQKAGRIDVLFVNAGFYELGKFGEVTEEHFDRTFKTNVRGLFFVVQKALPLLSQGSSVTIFTPNSWPPNAQAVGMRSVRCGPQSWRLPWTFPESSCV